jgi:hypothetical protein
MTAAKPPSEEAVVKALASQAELTSAEIAAAAGQIRQVSERPRRYSTATPPPSKRGRSRRPRTEKS